MSENKALEQPAAASMPAPTYDLRKVAIGQRIIIFSMLIIVIAIGLGYTMFSKTPNGVLVGYGLDILTAFVGITGVIYLGLALKWKIWLIVLCALSAFMGIVGLIVFAIMSERATRILKPAGYKVGFFGASKP